jgi:valyl-tRNA synthetase
MSKWRECEKCLNGVKKLCVNLGGSNTQPRWICAYHQEFPLTREELTQVPDETLMNLAYGITFSSDSDDWIDWIQYEVSRRNLNFPLFRARFEENREHRWGVIVSTLEEHNYMLIPVIPLMTEYIWLDLFE